MDRLALGAAFANPTSLRVSVQFRELSRSAETRYEDLYRTGIEQAQYNFMLTDYSFFQFSWLGKQNVRYAFYCNPFATTEAVNTSLTRLGELEELGFLTHEEYLAILSEQYVDNRHPMIRYEHAEEEYRPFDHPCAHLHIGHPPRGRWCVSRALTPYAFTMLILKHHYPAEWQSRGGDPAEPVGNVLEAALIKERSSLSEIAPAFLSILEKSTFRLD